MPKHTGSAHWEGGLQDGTGTVSTGTGALTEQPYGFKSRFEDGTQTNPEELIGAAHAACFSMAFSMILGQHDLTADEIDTKATVSLEKEGDGFAIKTIHLDMTAKIPGADEETFQKAANAAKEGCPVSKALASPAITLNASLS
jgi:osmotically inducible protein OsmC